MMKKVLTIALVLIIAAAALFGIRWYGYVTNTDSPYDEVGIELNSRAPGAMNTWGCDRLHQTFGDVVPPYGCQTTDGTAWR